MSDERARVLATIFRVIKSALKAFSLVACAFLFFVYGRRPDAWAAVTIFPAWLWPLCALPIHLAPRVLAVFSRVVRQRATGEKANAAREIWMQRFVKSKNDITRDADARRVLARRFLNAAPVWAWLFFALVFVEEARSVPRSLFVAPMKNDPSPNTLRIVSLNCAGGDPNAMREFLTFSPDIVLLQESPSRPDVAKLAQQLKGDFVYGPDASLVVARGALKEVVLPREERAYFVATDVKFASGARCRAVSVRLLPAVLRMDFWSRETRAAQSENRQMRRAMLQTLMRRVQSSASTRALIIGGDFNAPQDDAIFNILKPRLHDAFSEAGRGWGNTITHEFPVLRIDQIWLRGLQSLATESRRSEYSDHRIAVCDVGLRCK